MTDTLGPLHRRRSRRRRTPPARASTRRTPTKSSRAIPMAARPRSTRPSRPPAPPSRPGPKRRPRCARTCSTRPATRSWRAPEIGEMLSREEGKTRAEGIGETMRAARICKYFAGEALRRHGQTLESTRPGSMSQTYREAVGVVRADHAVELPDRDPGVEGRAGAGVRQHRGAQAGQHHAGHRRRRSTQILHRTRRAAGRVQPRARRGRCRPGDRRPSRRGRRSPSPARKASGSSVAEGAVDAPGARAARDGRQEPAGGARRRRSRARGGDRGRRRLLPDRPALHGLVAGDRHGGHSRPLRRGAGRAGQGPQGRRRARPATQIGPAVSEEPARTEHALRRTSPPTRAAGC